MNIHSENSEKEIKQLEDILKIKFHSDIRAFYSTFDEINKENGIDIFTLNEITNFYDTGSYLQFCFAQNSVTYEKWYLAINKSNPSKYFIFEIVKREPDFQFHKILSTTFPEFTALLINKDLESIQRISDKSEKIVKVNVKNEASAYFSYFLMKQFIFIIIFAISGILVLYTSMFTLSQSIERPKVESSRGIADSISQSFAIGIGYVITLLMFSLPIVVIVAGIFSAGIAGKWTGKFFDVAHHDNNYIFSTRVWRWYQPYLITLLAFLVLFFLLVGASIHNDSLYALLSIIILPVILYYSDKKLFYEYFDRQ